MSARSDAEFVRRFFSAPNTVWPGQDPAAPAAQRLDPFLKALTQRGECPLVLPRRDAAQDAASYYVICWDTAHAGRVRPLITAATADHWTPFDGRVARLDPSDPVDAAVLDLVGTGATFVLRPTRATASPAYKALSRLVQLLSGVPLRRRNVPRPIGRMLREFDVALASGSAEASEQILREIEALGGISHENVAFLQVRRLARLGRDADLLAHGSLATLVLAEPPRLVREAILAAWTRTHLPRPIQGSGVADATEAIKAARPDVALLVNQRLADSSDPDVSTFCALVALAAQDEALTAALAVNESVDDAVRVLLKPRDEGPAFATPARLGVEAPQAAVEPLPLPDPPLPAGDTDQIAPVDWVAWASALRSGTPRLDVDQFRAWPAAWSVDEELADAIYEVPDLATDALLAGVAGFLETDEPDRPAGRTAEALLHRYLIAERFAPYDLGAMCSLLEVVLRSAPSPARYRDVLNDVREYSAQWVAVATASRAVDIVDAVALGPASDVAARDGFVAALLGPLHQQRRRLSGGLRRLADLVTTDIGLDFDWSVPEEDHAPVTADGPAPRILLYSLDEGTLARVRKAIALQWPRAAVSTSADKDGSPALRQHARNAELVVMATRRAAHAATGFITANAQSALIQYPDGAGSASMLRAVEAGISRLYA